MKKLYLIALSLVIPFMSNAVVYDIEQAFVHKNVLPVVVLGSGPAGYTAALQTCRAGWPTTIITGPLKGGQLMGTSMVDNYPGIKRIFGSALPEAMAEQVIECGAQILEDTAVEVNLRQWPFEITTEQGKILRTLVLIIATGATPKKLGIPGEEQYWGNGVSSCALCDCKFFKNMHVFVVGGGDAAAEEALQLAPYAQSVTILVRKNQMRAVRHMQEKLGDYPKITTVLNKQVTRVLGNEESVTDLEIQDTITGEKTIVPGDGLFLAIGHTPNTELFKNQLELKPSGHIIMDGRSQMTFIPGVFAAGDVEDDQFRQAAIAVGRGCQAGLEAVSWLRAIGVTQRMLQEPART